MRCERCKKNFIEEDAREEFELEEPTKSYDNFEIKLCGKCAIEVINDLEDGFYYEFCEECGDRYDFIRDNAEFEHKYTNEYGSYASISDLTNKLLCLDCAIDEYENYEDNYM